MSARGARSRKAIAKDIEKKEKKAAQKGKAVETVRRPHDAFADWTTGTESTTSNRAVGRFPSRQLTTSTSRSSSTNDSSSRPPLRIAISQGSSDPHRSKTSATRPESVSDTSSAGKEKQRYQTNGKETKAPRGRRGGVPVKKPVSDTPVPPLFRAESSLNYPSAVPNHKTWMNFRVWQGGEHGMRPYGGFEMDEDMQNGSVLIYFKEEQMHEDRPIPQLRAELDVLENCGSTWLSNALLYGRIDDNDDWTLAGSPESSGPRQSFSPNFPLPPGQRHMLAPSSPGGSPPPFNIDQTYYGVPGYGSESRAQYYPDSDRSGAFSPPPSFRSIQPPQATHELWFTAPAHLKTPQAQRLHHVAVRNFLAILHNKPIVGADLYDMLTTLQPEIQVMYDLDHNEHSRMTPVERSVQMITNYLAQHRLDDVRNSIKQAISLLAWAEQENVRWRQGYLESFVHLAGMLSPKQIEELPECKRLSLGTRRNLLHAVQALRLRVLDAEEVLGTFEFGDMWPDLGKNSGSPVYQSYQAFRQFLVDYLTRIYGDWPPSQDTLWLNRKVVLDLQRDFGMLYDYLVNRDVVWDTREERSGNKWQMVNRKTEDFRANLPELALMDMLVTWDNAHGYDHIPHAYPLLPRDVPQARVAQKKSLFSGLKKSKVDTTKDAKAHLQLSIVFSDATNIDKLDSSFSGNVLIDSFEQFELGADLKGTTPREARLGRWTLLYGILQVLSKLSVDVHSLKYTDGVRYFLCTDLNKFPDWVTAGHPQHLEASQQRSWCWQRAWAASPARGEPAELEASSLPPAQSEELDGTLLDGEARLNNDVRRIGEKIDNMSMARPDSRSAARRILEERRANQKMAHGEVAAYKMDQSYRLTESDYVAARPLVPSRSPLRSPALDIPRYYQGRDPFPGSPQEYPASPSPHEYPASPQAYTPEERNMRYEEERRGWR